MRCVLLVVGAILLCCPAAAAQRQDSHAASRARLLGELRKCVNPSAPSVCSEDSVAPVARLYERGDTGVLPKLMDVAPRSDGALAEALGDFFSDLLCRKPKTFLRAVATRPRREQDKLLFLAAAADGGGMGCRDLDGLRRRLNALSHRQNDPLAALSRRCLERVNRYSRHRPA